MRRDPVRHPDPEDRARVNQLLVSVLAFFGLLVVGVWLALAFVGALQRL